MWPDTILRCWIEACLDDLRATLSPAMTLRLDRHLGERSREGDLLYNFTRAAQPVVHLPVWVAESLALMDRPVEEVHVRRAVWSAVSGYLYAQLQDQIVDEAQAVDTQTMLLAQALFLHHHKSLWPALAMSEGYRRRWQGIWEGYTSALSLERQLARGQGVRARVEFEAILGRSLPMVLPGGSLLSLSGSDALLPKLEAVVRLTTYAAQLADDAVDALEDLADGNLTWVVCNHGGLEGAGALAQQLYFGGGFDRILDEATERLDEACHIALSAGFGALAYALEGQEHKIESVRSLVYSRLLRSVGPAMEPKDTNAMEEDLSVHYSRSAS